MYGDLSSIAGWPEMDNPDRIKASRPESPLPLYFSTWGPKWLPLTSGPGLIISRPVSLFVGRFSVSPLSPPPPQPACCLWGVGGVECKLGRVKAFFTQLRSASPFEPLSAANSGDEWNGYNLDPPCVLSESANKSPSSSLRTEETRKVRSKSSAKFSF